MRHLLIAALITFAPVVAHTQSRITTRDARFHSEAVQCYAKLFFPPGFAPTGQAAAVVLAPGWGETAASIERYAEHLAARGLVAMTIDYRGWGRSGAFIYLADNVRWDDRLRFSQHTVKVRLRRKRLLPEAQLTDIRNAITYLQGEPGVDAARIGVWGTGMSGGHVVALAAIDARIRAGVAQTPLIPGKDVTRLSFDPTAAQQADMIRLARNGSAPSTPAAATAMNDLETKLALADYMPFRLLDQISKSSAILFVVAEKDATVNNESNAVAASKLLAGPTTVTTVPGSTHAMTGKAGEAAASAAADWFVKHLIPGP
jgi:dienelactone hydrolase